MFRKTESTPQLDLFTAPSNILPRRAQKKYTDEKHLGNLASLIVELSAEKKAKKK